jgi:uncharacterized membrane protein
MKAILTKFRDITISGILALLPLYVFLIVISKAWKSLNSIGFGIAQMLGIKSVLGVAGATIVSGLLTIGIWIVTGFLVRYSFLGTVTKAAERQLSKFVPDYEIYKAKAEEKLQNKARNLPYLSVLIKFQEYWQPAYVVEQDKEGNCVVFVPDIPETNKGKVLLAKLDQLEMVSSLTANQLDESLRKAGTGLLSEHRLCSAKARSTNAGRVG